VNSTGSYERYHGLVLGSGGRNGALRTPVAGVSRVLDSDLVRSWRSGGLGVGRGKGRENESYELRMHLEALLSESGDGSSEWCLRVSEVLICDDQ
jgi:hypothetical protein